VADIPLSDIKDLVVGDDHMQSVRPFVEALDIPWWKEKEFHKAFAQVFALGQISVSKQS
jgi:hypothetical protein